jgi:hypothetical protein
MPNNGDEIDISKWIDAWRAKMAEFGYPRAQLDIFPVEKMMVSYTWTFDVNALFWSDERFELERKRVLQGWQQAHIAFVEVDHLRPDQCPPTKALRKLLNERN